MQPDLPAPTSSRSSGEIRAWSEDPLTARARAVWNGGDFLPIARSFAPGAAAFVRRLGLRRGELVLDVACGTGNLAIPAAQAGARVTGVDLSPGLIATAREEAEAARCAVTFEVGNAESLSYDDSAFDTTMSMFGAMFAYRPDCAAAELVRVTKPGGRIAMANWTPDGFVGRMLKAHVAVAPPPAGVPSPLQWGRPEVVRELFGEGVDSVRWTLASLELAFPMPPAAVTELFATCYGPTVATLRATDPEGAHALRAALTRLFTEHNRATDGTTTVVGEYLDVQARVA